MAVWNVNTPALLQAALDGCVAGDEIVLDRTVTFEADTFTEFTPKNRGVIPAGQEIVIRSSTLPPELNVRPDYRITLTQGDNFATIRARQASNYRNYSAIQFAPTANGYILRNLKFTSGYQGRGTMISIGRNDSGQTEYSQIPYNITIDQCSFVGARLLGQRNAITTHGDAVTIKNSQFYNINMSENVGNDSTCIYSVNCRGPLSILNNEFNGGTEPFITGGDDPFIISIATITSPTVNGGTLSTTKDLSIGQHVAILISANTDRQFSKITAINTTTGVVTWSPALTVVPDTPGDVRWGTQLANITFRRNWVHRDPALRNTIIPSPTGISYTPAAGGSFTAGTYYFQVQAVAKQLGNNAVDLFSDRTAETSIDVTAGQKITAAWTASTDATHYRVWRYQKSGTTVTNSVYFETTGLSFADVGTGGSAASLQKAGKWNLKNLGELKTGVNVQWDSNIHEEHWQGSDNGYAIWMKNNNQVSRHEFSRLENVTFEWNLLRRVNGFLSFSGRRAAGNALKDLPISPLTAKIKNNLIYYSTNEFLNEGGVSPFGIDEQNSCKDVEYDHNTLIHLGRGAYRIGQTNTAVGYFPQHKITNNLFLRQTYGIWDIAGAGEGSIPINKWCRPTAVDANDYTFSKNVIAEATSGNYPNNTNNFFPTLTTFQAQFKNYAAGQDGNFKLKRISEGDSIDSLYINAGTDGKDIGCDIVTLESKVVGVREGNPETAPPPPEPGGGNVSERILSFIPSVTGNVTLDFGFQTKAILFFYQDLAANGEGSHFTLGIGVAVGAGEQWAESFQSQNATSVSDTAAARVGDACVIGISNLAAENCRVQFVSHNPTDATVNVVTANAGIRVFALGLGGSGISGVRAGIIAMKATVGVQDYDIGLNNITGLIFASLINGSTTRPQYFNKSSSLCIGLADENLNQGTTALRIKNSPTTDISYRHQTNDSCFVAMSDTAVNVKANLTAIIANGFRLNFSVANGFTDGIPYFAIAGARVLVGSFNGSTTLTPATQTISIPPFVPETMIALSTGVSVLNTFTTNSRLALGISTADDQFAIWAGQKNAPGGNQIAKSIQHDNAFIEQYTELATASTEEVKATRSSTLPNGLVLTWTNVDAAALKYNFMSIGSAVEVDPIEMESIDVASAVENIALTSSIRMATVDEYAFTEVITPLLAVAAFKSIIELFNLRITLDVKREVDSGHSDVEAIDTGSGYSNGTFIPFNKTFRSVDSITLTAMSVTPITPIVNFDNSLQDPEGFRVLMYDLDGVRVDGTVAWKARGIV